LRMLAVGRGKLSSRPSLRPDIKANNQSEQINLLTASLLLNRIWLLEAAEEYPNANALEGLDIALHQAPAQHLLPDNVRFRHLDLQEDIPAELVGRYDLVHARFLLGLVKNNDPLPLLKNLLKLLST
jgi:hypothetical protein